VVTVAVVVPTIREECFKRWQDEWKDDLGDRAQIYVVEDNPERTFAVSSDAQHYSWAEIGKDLGDRAWIIPRRTSACRSYGFWKAWQSGADVIWTLDDDVYPEDGQRGRYLSILATILASDRSDASWFNTIASSGLYPRGYPYGIRDARWPVMMHHGLWSSVPDLDGLTQKANPDARLKPATATEVVPYGQFFPMCIMNLAFRRELTPALYMLLMGKDQGGQQWGFDRFDDMWAGLFTKRICDHLGWAITSGAPSVHHSKASLAETNIRLEAAGIEAHEDFWRYVRDVSLSGCGDVFACYRKLAEATWAVSGGYWKRLGRAMGTWSTLLEEAR
jgi:Reversibly glycosylated polypeptide